MLEEFKINQLKITTLADESNEGYKGIRGLFSALSRVDIQQIYRIASNNTDQYYFFKELGSEQFL